MPSRIRIHAQEGLTLIEVMVALMLLTGGMFATLTMFDSGQRASAGTTRSQSAYNLAESYLERAVNVTTSAQWTALALSSAPVGVGTSGATNPDNPAEYLRTTATTTTACGVGLTTCAYFRVATDPSNSASAALNSTTPNETLVINTTSGVVAPKVTLPNGDGYVYQFVTTAADRTITVNGTTFYGKRVLVGVVLTSDPLTNSVTKPVWVSTIVTDPTVTSP